MPAAVTYLDRDGRSWRTGVVELRDGVIRMTDAAASSLPRLDGVITGGFTDAHVHLQLVEHTRLDSSTLGAVGDLGGDPAVMAGMRRTRFPRVAFAGAFLTPPGGYPSDRAWAPAGSVRELPDADAAASAVAEMLNAGAACVKIASNSVAGPVFTDEMFTTIVQIAASHGLRVVAHAEGPGQAQRAARLGARTLAHAPFTERLSEDELREMCGLGVSWISTLAIHDGEAREIAVENVRRFHALGGSVRYGTDMGNGPTPVDLNQDEISALRTAGIDGADLLHALEPVDPTRAGARLLFLPGATPATADPSIARPLTAADLEVPR